MAGPLTGIKILDFTWALAGPFGVMQLCDLGAEVWKVEPMHVTEEVGRGSGPIVDGINTFCTGDVLVHTWDLARATGQDERLDPAKCAVMLEGMLPMDEALRQSGHYGPRVDVPEDADVQTRLLAFIGRHP